MSLISTSLSYSSKPSLRLLPALRLHRFFSSSWSQVESTPLDEKKSSQESNATFDSCKTSGGKKKGKKTSTGDVSSSDSSDKVKDSDDYYPIKIRWKIDAYCPDTDVYVKKDTIEPMSKYPIIWRKYMRIDDKHSPLFLACQVKDDGIADENVGWKDMPRLKGRS